MPKYSDALTLPRALCNGMRELRMTTFQRVLEEAETYAHAVHAEKTEEWKGHFARMLAYIGVSTPTSFKHVAARSTGEQSEQGSASFLLVAARFLLLTMRAGRLENTRSRAQSTADKVRDLVKGRFPFRLVLLELIIARREELGRRDGSP
jgi:hypothetical protein